MIESQYPALSIVYRVSYLQNIMAIRSVTITVRLLVVVLIDDCCMYIYIIVQFVDTTHLPFFSIRVCMYIVYCIVLQLVYTVWPNDEIGTSLNSTHCLSPSPPVAVAADDCYI